jgi:hypothetical protein
MSGKGCGIQQSFHPPHPPPPPQPGNLCDRFMGGTVWHWWCGNVSSVIVILGGEGGVSHSYTLQELPPEGRSHTPTLCRNSRQRGCLTLLRSAGTPIRGESHTPTLYRHSSQREVSHSYSLQALPSEGSLTLLHSTGTPAIGKSHTPTLCRHSRQRGV